MWKTKRWMQYSMNDHKNQPTKKSGRKVYLWIGIEKSGNTHTHRYWHRYYIHTSTGYGNGENKHVVLYGCVRTQMRMWTCKWRWKSLSCAYVLIMWARIAYNCVCRQALVCCVCVTWSEDYPGGALCQGGVAVPAEIKHNRQPHHWYPVPVARENIAIWSRSQSFLQEEMSFLSHFCQFYIFCHVILSLAEKVELCESELGRNSSFLCLNRLRNHC